MTSSLWKIGAVLSAITLGGGYVVWQQHLADKKAEQRDALNSLAEGDPTLMLSSKSLGGGMQIQDPDEDGDFLLTTDDDPVLMPSSKVGIQTLFIEIPFVYEPEPITDVPARPTEEEEMRRTLMKSSKSGFIPIDEEELQNLLEKTGVTLGEEAEEETEP